MQKVLVFNTGFAALLMFYSKIYSVFKILSYAVFGMHYSNDMQDKSQFSENCDIVISDVSESNFLFFHWILHLILRILSKFQVIWVTGRKVVEVKSW